MIDIDHLIGQLVGAVNEHLLGTQQPPLSFRESVVLREVLSNLKRKEIQADLGMESEVWRHLPALLTATSTTIIINLRTNVEKKMLDLIMKNKHLVETPPKEVAHG